MVAGTDIQIVEARKEHAPFIAWAMLTAARSHLPVGMWDLLCGGSERETLRLLEALATTGDAHWAHYSLFFVAEVDGQPASALAAYIERENGAHTLLEPLRAANATVARADDDLAAGWARAGSIGRVNPQHDPTTLVVEHVATLPDYRRQGLIDRLLAAALDRGRSRRTSNRKPARTRSSRQCWKRTRARVTARTTSRAAGRAPDRSAA